MNTYLNIYFNGLQEGIAKQAASLGGLTDAVTSKIPSTNGTSVSISAPTASMGPGKGAVSQILSKVLNNPTALGATAGGLAGAAHGAIAPGRDEEGKGKGRISAALARGGIGAAAGGAIGYGAGEVGKHNGMIQQALLKKLAPGAETTISDTGILTNTITR